MLGDTPAHPADVVSRSDVMLRALRNGRLLRVQAAYLIYNIVEWASWIAILVWAYDAGGVRAASALAVVQLVPAALLASPAATWLDRLTRARALTLGYAIQALDHGGHRPGPGRARTVRVGRRPGSPGRRGDDPHATGAPRAAAGDLGHDRRADRRQLDVGLGRGGRRVPRSAGLRRPHSRGRAERRRAGHGRRIVPCCLGDPSPADLPVCVSRGQAEAASSSICCARSSAIPRPGC